MWVSRINAVSGCEFQELWGTASKMAKRKQFEKTCFPFRVALRNTLIWTTQNPPGPSQNSSRTRPISKQLTTSTSGSRLAGPQSFANKASQLPTLSARWVFEKSFIFLSFLRTRFNSPLASCTNQRPAWLSNSCKTPRLDDRTTSFGKETCFQPARAPVYFPLFRQDPTFSSYSIFTTPSHQTANQPYVPWDWIIYLHLA